MKRRGQKVKLKHADTGEVLTVVVVLSDSIQGYLAYRQKGDWAWYSPKEWSEVG